MSYYGKWVSTPKKKKIHCNCLSDGFSIPFSFISHHWSILDWINVVYIENLQKPDPLILFVVVVVVVQSTKFLNLKWHKWWPSSSIVIVHLSGWLWLWFWSSTSSWSSDVDIQVVSIYEWVCVCVCILKNTSTSCFWLSVFFFYCLLVIITNEWKWEKKQKK